MRIANLPTAIANVAAGAALASHIDGDLNFIVLRVFPVAVFASVLLYSSGMILNDAFDADVDAVERPERPIPSGRIGRSTAFKVGFSLIMIAIVTPISLALFEWYSGATQHLSSLLNLSDTTLLLSVMIVLYNGPLKRTWLAAPTMGSCRTLNILLGAFSAGSASSFAWQFDQRWFAYAISIGLFVTGITLLARSETKDRQSRVWLSIGAVTMLAAFLGMAFYIQHKSPVTVTQAYWAMLAIIAFPIIRTLIMAVQKANGPAVGKAIVTALSSLIFLDAAVCFLVRPDQPIYAGAVALLIVPVMILRRFSAQT